MLFKKFKNKMICFLDVMMRTWQCINNIHKNTLNPLKFTFMEDFN